MDFRVVKRIWWSVEGCIIMVFTRKETKYFFLSDLDNILLRFIFFFWCLSCTNVVMNNNVVIIYLGRERKRRFLFGQRSCINGVHTGVSLTMVAVSWNPPFCGFSNNNNSKNLNGFKQQVNTK